MSNFNHLIYEANNGGTLYTNWSEVETFPGSLVCFQAGKPVPKFKITQNGGRAELIRDCAGVKVRNLLTGVAQFVKMAREFKGLVTVTGGETFEVPFRIYTLTGTDVKRLEPGAATPVEGIQAVAALPREADAYSGVKTMAASMFSGAAQRGNGAHLSF
eukprot:TRINITY_DN581_c0_g1_i2.p2 TRINITY_DN581_c0_g1~~TRINITY_DN581_c0_g1_i2.p2  ORF type:complete len:159 (-),score=25.41 TRINITY_DN581_c0_g1_i2:241-717(-)